MSQFNLKVDENKDPNEDEDLNQRENEYQDLKEDENKDPNEDKNLNEREDENQNQKEDEKPFQKINKNQKEEHIDVILERAQKDIFFQYSK